jgi:uncharacterized protein with HEPN domain
MPSDQTRLALYDIRDNGKLAQDFVAGLSFEGFRDNRLFFYAVTRALEMISEAARRLPAELRDRHSELQWRAIMGVGNVYRHNYDTVAEEGIRLAGSPIYSTAVGDGPKSYFIRVGTVRQRDQLVPKTQIWSRSRRHWVTDIGSIRTIDKQ